MLCALRDAALRRALLPVLLLLLLIAACTDQMKQLMTAADLRGQIESALWQIEVGKQVAGLRHRHETVEPDPDIEGFAVRIYDLKLGTPDSGYQSFSQMSFSLAQSDDTHFAADKFALTPAPIGDGPTAAAQTLVALLQRAVSTLQRADD